MRPGELVSIAVALKIHRPERLQAFVEEQSHAGSPGFGQTLSPSAYRTHFAPPKAARQRVAGYLRRQGFSDVQVSDDGMMVTATGSVAVIESAFNTHVAQAMVDDDARLGNTTALQLPARIAPWVEGILGLDQLHQAKVIPHTESASVGQPPLPGAAPASAQPAANTQSVSASYIYTYQFPGLYEADTLPRGNNTTVGVITVGSDQTVIQPVMDNLSRFVSYYDYPRPNVSSVRGVYGKVGQPDRNNDSGSVLEYSADTQVVLAMAGGSVGRMVLYKSPSYSYDDMSQTMATAVSDGRSKVINMSILGCYGDVSRQVVNVTNNLLQEAKAQGITFAVSSGDYGSNACDGFKRSNKARQSFSLALADETQSWPASHANLMAIGGTTLYRYDNGNYAKETTYNDLRVNGDRATTGTAAGGGESRYVTKPAYQQGIVPGNGRGVPDISLNGACSSPAVVYNNGWSTFCGTSLSAPLFTGLYARLQTAFDNQLGLPNSAFYKMFSQSPNLVHDVTEGNIGAYSAGNGWDYATGFGSIRGQAVYDYINQNGGF